MSWMFPSAIATTVDTFILVLVYLYLYFQNRERYLGIWTLGWSIYLLRFVFELWMLVGPKSAVPLAAIQITAFVSGLFLLWGTYIFLGKRISPLWLYGAGLTTILMAVGFLSGISFITSTLPAFVFLGIIYIWLGSSLLSYRQLEGIGRQVTGWGFIAWGIHKMDYPFLQPVTWFAPWGYLLGATLEITVAIGILLIYVQQTKKELRAREERFRLLAENARDLIYRYQLKPIPRFEYVSPSATAITGYTPEEFYNDPQMCFRLIHPDDEPLIESIKNLVVLTEQPIILRWIKKGGELIWVEQHNTPVYDKTGDIIAFESIVRDITERKLATDKLKDSEERYRRLVELSPDAIAVHSEGKLVYINATGMNMVGAKRPAELIGKPMLDFVHPDYHELVKSRVGTMAEGSVVELLEEKFLTLDGEAIDVEVAAMPISYNGKPAMQVYVRDITERKRKEEELKFKSFLLDSATDSVFVLDLEGKIVYINEAACKTRGYAREELLGMTLQELDTPEFSGSVKERIDMIKRDGSAVFEAAHLTKDGAVMNVEVHAHIMEFNGEEVIVAIARDITERKGAEEALQEQKEFSERLIQNSTAGIFVLDADHKVILWNKACEELTGVKAADIVGTDNHWQAFYGKKRPCLADLIIDGRYDEVSSFYDAYGESKLASGGLHAESWYTGLGGQDRYVIIDATPIYNSKGDLVAVVETLQDITQRKRIEEALEHERNFTSNILDTVGSLVLVLDRKGRIIRFNRACEEITGYTFEEVKDKYIFDVLIPPEESEKVKGVFSKLKAGQFPNSYENYWMTKDGERRLIAWSNTALTDANGEVEWIIPTGIDVTERKKVEKELIDREHRYRSIINGAAEGFWMLNADLETVEVNDSLCDMLGYTREEMLGKKPFDFVDEENLQIFKKQTAKIPGTAHRHYDIVLKSKSGEDVYTRFNATTIKEENGSVVSAFAFVTNITGLKLAEGALIEAKERMEQLYRVIPSAIFTVDKGGIVNSFNKKAEEITGYTAEEVIGNRCTVFALEPCTNKCGLFSGNFKAPVQAKECTIKRKDGEIRTILKNADLFKDANGNILGGVESFEDITERKQTEKMLNYMAYYDSLTSLPNRMLLNDRLTLALSYAHRNKEMLAVMFLDLDNFKTINDTLGHTIGDKLLQSVSRRLSGCLREGDTIARLGGDEFVLLLPQIQHEEDAAKVAKKVLESLKPPFSYEGQDLHVTTSIGISLYPHDGKDVQTLLKNADAALYRAKEEGKNNYQLYTPALNAKAFERLSLENSMRKALERGEFILYYQPQIELVSCETIGMEALIRWQHPELGLIQPTDFVPIAEETGLIVPIGEWALRNACEQGKEWQEQGYRSLRISVNLSAIQFTQQDVVDMVERALSETGFNPENLELEITESVLMHDPETTTETLLKVKEMGVKVSIDDFGTGYSSLSYLKQFPIDRLKIDRMFIHALTENSSDAAIAKAIIAMAHNLGLKVVAEGVEETTQLEILRSLKCDEVQGYLLSIPLPVEEATKLLAGGNSLCA